MQLSEGKCPITTECLLFLSRKSWSGWLTGQGRDIPELTKRRRDSTRAVMGRASAPPLGRKPQRLSPCCIVHPSVRPLLVIDHDNRRWRPRDQNIGYVAEYLTAVDSKLEEVRMVGEEETAIIDARRRVAPRSAGVLYRRPRARARGPNSQGLGIDVVQRINRRRRITCIVTFATISTNLL